MSRAIRWRICGVEQVRLSLWIHAALAELVSFRFPKTLRLAIIQETYEADATVSIGARRHDIVLASNDWIEPLGISLGVKWPENEKTPQLRGFRLVGVE